MLKNVTLAFPSLFEKKVFGGGDDLSKGKYEASFLIDKETQNDQYEKVKKAIQELMAENKKKVPSANWFLKDGDDVSYDGFEGKYSIKSSTKYKPTCVTKDKLRVVADEREAIDDNTIVAPDMFYAGCVVNAKINLWIQDNAYGKKVNASLLGVQFVKDGKRYEGKKVADIDDFEDIG